ncbi:hypothetical protein RR48_00091, partial [Papilio machaon]
NYDTYPVQYEQAVYRKPLREHEKPQDLRNVPGVPGVDYPIYHQVPDTRFSCAHVPVHPGMYANVETGCQVKRNNKLYYSFISHMLMCSMSLPRTLSVP